MKKIKRKNGTAKTKRNRGKAAAVLVCAVIAGTVAGNGIMAYFTDGDTAVNTFTVGKIALELEEPGWEEQELITPGQKIKKDPQIVNTGLNSEFVFLEVSIPYKNVMTAAADGTKEKAGEKELFIYTVNQGWTELGTGEKNPNEGTITHRYVYGTSQECTPLLKDERTPALFESVTFINVVEGQGLEEGTQNVTVNAYGIQTTDINGGVKAPGEVWKVLSGQLPIGA